MASLRAMQTMQTQMVAQVTQLIAGLSGSLEGDSSSQGPSPACLIQLVPQVTPDPLSPVGGYLYLKEVCLSS